MVLTYKIKNTSKKGHLIGFLIFNIIMYMFINDKKSLMNIQCVVIVCAVFFSFHFYKGPK